MTFQREDRYIVIKRKDLQHITAQSREKLDDLLDVIPGQHRRYLVIESDWPEYEPAWAVIEARMSGKPLPQSEREAALQQRLNEADQRIDELRHVGLELSGTMAEYRQMPCKSLQDRMFATYDRYVKRLAPTDAESPEVGS